MISKTTHLSKDVFTDKVEQKATRDGFGEGLVEAAKKDDSIVALCADLTESVRMNLFADEFPERFVEIGIGEQNLVTVASGMAAAGKNPFASSYAAFSPGRNWEQIRTTICYNNQPVKIVGSHSGLTVGPDGATHQMLEDLTLMRVLPNMTVLYPGDYHEAKMLTLQAAKMKSPVYIRLAREKSPVFFTSKSPCEIGKAIKLHSGDSVTLISTGPLTIEALKAAKELKADLIHVSTIKPLDKKPILKSVRKTGRALTIEEHQINGGLGGAVAELLVEYHPVPMKRVGMQDRFGESGDPNELWEHFKLTAPHIVAKAKELIG